MARIIECVPNCSEGRDKEIIEYIADAVRSVPGVALMDYSSDENHNRSVYTIVGRGCIPLCKSLCGKNRHDQTSRRTSAYGRCRRNPVHSC